MKIGMNLLLWATHVTEEHYPQLEKIKATGFETPGMRLRPARFARAKALCWEAICDECGTCYRPMSQILELRNISKSVVSSDMPEIISMSDRVNRWPKEGENGINSTKKQNKKMFINSILAKLARFQQRQREVLGLGGKGIGDDGRQPMSNARS
jgi:hypothetical protein